MFGCGNVLSFHFSRQSRMHANTIYVRSVDEPTCCSRVGFAHQRRLFASVFIAMVTSVRIGWGEMIQCGTELQIPFVFHSWFTAQSHQFSMQANKLRPIRQRGVDERNMENGRMLTILRHFVFGTIEAFVRVLRPASAINSFWKFILRAHCTLLICTTLIILWAFRSPKLAIIHFCVPACRSE